MGCCARISSYREVFCGPESYCGSCWSVSPSQRALDSRIRTTRVTIFVTISFTILAIVFCFLASKPGFTKQRLYSALFIGFLSATPLPFIFRCCICNPPKPRPKPPPKPKEVEEPEEEKNEEVHV